MGLGLPPGGILTSVRVTDVLAPTAGRPTLPAFVSPGPTQITHAWLVVVRAMAARTELLTHPTTMLGCPVISGTYRITKAAAWMAPASINKYVL